MQALWDQYWFEPTQAGPLRLVHKLVSFIAAVWFFGLMTSGSFWWGSHGFSAARLSSNLESFTEGDWLARFRLTPLWLSDSFTVIATWCGLGVLLSVLNLVQAGGRWLRALHMVWILLLAQRLTWTTGNAEPLLVALTGYVSIARFTKTAHWSHGFSSRLIQMHIWLLLCAALVNQLAFEPWWQGDAAWWLAASGRSTLLSTSFLEGRLILSNLITHAMTLGTAIAVVCLWPLAARPSVIRIHTGMIAGWSLALGYALMADQVLYGGLLAAGICIWNWNASASKS